MGCKGSKKEVQATTPTNRVKEIVTAVALEPSTLHQTQGEPLNSDIHLPAEEEKSPTVRVSSFHLPLDSCLPSDIKPGVTTRPATTRRTPPRSMGSQALLNVLYDEPVTNQELELQKTLAEGRVKLEDLHRGQDVSQGSLDEPKMAFLSSVEL